MIDTLRTLGKTVEKASDNGIELINKVDAFYNSAWDKLILVGTVAFGVIGILVPFVIQWYQKKTLEISEELLKKEIENQSLKIKTELLNDINKTLEERLTDFEVKIEKLNASITAKAFHLQGNTSIKEGLTYSALSDYIKASGGYLVCEDYMNLQIVLNNIDNNFTPIISFEDISNLKISDNCDLDLLLSQIADKDGKNIFTLIIRSIRGKLAKLPQNNKSEV